MVHPTLEMGKILNGNGNGHGAHNLIHPASKKGFADRGHCFAPSNQGNAGGFSNARTGGVARHALVRTTRLAVVFELYNPIVTPRFSEALEEFKIIFQERLVYSGRAIVQSNGCRNKNYF